MTRVPGGGHNISPDGRKMVVSGIEKPYNSEKYLDLQVIPLNDGIPMLLTNDEEHENIPAGLLTESGSRLSSGKKHLIIKVMMLFKHPRRRR